MTFPRFDKAWFRAFLPRFLFCVLGNILNGVGVAFVKLSVFGNDPFNGSCFAVSGFFDVPYTFYTLGFNCFWFLFEILFGRKHIGIGTFINWFLLCYVVEFSLFLFGDAFAATVAETLWLRILFLILGVLTCALGLAIYQHCDTGVSPFDSMPLIVTEHFPKIRFAWARMFFDCFCMALILLFRGTFGVGTILITFGLGPLIHFFTFLIQKFIPEKKPVPAGETSP